MSERKISLSYLGPTDVMQTKPIIMHIKSPLYKWDVRLSVMEAIDVHDQITNILTMLKGDRFKQEKT